MGKLFLIISLFVFSGCQTTTVTSQKGKWKVMNSSNPADMQPQTPGYVPSGTELNFTSTKKFNTEEKQIAMKISETKRCSLTTNFDKVKEVELTPDTVLTVVGYRGETSELVLTDSSYQQYYLSCMSKQEQKRKTSSVKKSLPMTWKKANVEIADIQKMSPLLKVKYIPQ